MAKAGKAKPINLALQGEIDRFGFAGFRHCMLLGVRPVGFDQWGSTSGVRPAGFDQRGLISGV